MNIANYATVVPWHNPDQFFKVYSSLFSLDLTSKRWAVDQISVWESRCHPSLPTAVEASVVLVRAIIQDILFESNASLCQERDIQLLYSMALVRFINLVVELDQTSNSRTAMTVIAQKRGIPCWIVELRHEATHSFCPPLAILRIGTETSLQYLEHTYWRIEGSNLQPLIKRADTSYEQTIVDTMNHFQVLRYNVMLQKPEGHAGEFQSVWHRIRQLIKKHKKEFINVFVRYGLFVNSRDELEQLLTIPSDQAFMEKDDVYELPTIIERFWAPVIFLLHRYDLISDFIEILLLTQNDRDPLGQKLVMAWTLKVFQTYVFQRPSNSEIVKLFLKHGGMLNWKRLLYACVKYPVPWSKFALPLIVSALQLSQKWTLELVYLLAIFRGEVVPKDERKDRFWVFTLDDLKKNVTEEGEERKRMEEQFQIEYCWFVQKDDIKYSDVPVGTIFNPQRHDPYHPDHYGKLLDQAENNAVLEDYSDVENFLPNENDNEEIEEMVTDDSASVLKNETELPESEIIYIR